MVETAVRVKPLEAAETVQLSFKDAVKNAPAAVSPQEPVVITATTTTTTTTATAEAVPVLTPATALTESAEWVKVVQEVQDKPVLAEVRQQKFVERHEHVEFSDEIEQPIIELHEKPIVKNITHDTLQVRSVEPTKYTLEDHSSELGAAYERVIAPSAQHAPRQVREQDQVRVIQDAPEVVAVHRKQVVEVHERPIITEVHKQPVVEVHERPVIRHVVEKPIVRVVRDKTQYVQEELSSVTQATLVSSEAIAAAQQVVLDEQAEATLEEDIVEAVEGWGLQSAWNNIKRTVKLPEFWVPLLFVGASMATLWAANRIVEVPLAEETIVVAVPVAVPVTSTVPLAQVGPLVRSQPRI